MTFKYRFLVLVTVFGCLSFAMPSHADDKDARIEGLEQQIQVMMQELQALKQERRQEKREHAALKQTVEQLQASSVQAVEPAAGKDDVEITMSPTPKIKKGDFEWQPFGRIQLDAAKFEDDAADHPNGAEFRRARLGMKGKVSKDFGYKVEADFANEGVDFKDVFINYTGIEGTEVRVGHFKPNMGFEEMTSANDITFIERSSASSAFLTGEIIGAGVLTGGENWSAGAGVFNDDAGVQSMDDEAWLANARLTVAPLSENGNALHLGGSVTYHEPDQANDTFDFDAKAENALQTMDSVSAVITDAEDATIYGLEAGGALGPVSVQGEYFFADVENRAGNDPVFEGGYAQFAWVVTGENRPYKAGKGVFGRPKPANPFNVSKGHFGAFELAARYSHLNLSDGGINGGEMDNITLGVNWYLNDYIRLMGNYIIVDTDNDAVTANDDPSIALVRAQVNF